MLRPNEVDCEIALFRIVFDVLEGSFLKASEGLRGIDVDPYIMRNLKIDIRRNGFFYLLFLSQ